MTGQAEANRRIVLDYFQLTFNSHDPQAAAENYLSEDYVHHGPGSNGGREGFVAYFRSYFADHPAFRVTVQECVAEHDLVVLRVHAREHDDDPGCQVAEFYRLANGRIREHWDVIQPVRR